MKQVVIASSPVQAEFQVTLLPTAGGEVTREAEMFVGGFAGTDSPASTGSARAKPTGLAMGPGGSVYISDSVRGRIWKIDYIGS
jgi:hypothetical protein